MSDEVYPEPVLTASNQDQLFISVVRKSFREADRFRSPIKKKWDYHFRLLQGAGARDAQVKAWQTNRFINLIKVASTLLKSRFYQGLPIGQVQARTLEASVNQDNMNNVLLYDQERGHFEVELGKTIDDGINFACGLMYQGWRTETVENLPRTQNFLDKMFTAIKKIIPGFKMRQILYDGPEWRWVDPFSFRWDPNGTDIDDCSYTIETTWETIYQMRKDPAIDPDILEEVAKYQNNIDSLGEDLRERMLTLGLTPMDTKRLYGKIKDGLHEVHRYWGSYDIDGDGVEEEVRGIVIDWMFVGCKEENPFWHGKKPYGKWPFDTTPGFFVGYSLIDQAAQSQEEINDIANQSGDVRKLTLKPVIKFRLGSDTEPETLQVAPGMLWGLESPDDVVIEQPPTGAIEALMNVANQEREYFQLLTGMNDVSLGQQDVGIGDNTATGAAIAQEQTELRYKSPAIALDLFMERMGEMQMSNTQQFRNRKEIVPVMSKEGKTTYAQIAPKDLSGLFSYSIISSSLSMQTPTMKINNLLKALQLVNGNPNYSADPLIDQILIQTGIDPKTVKVGQPSDMSAVEQFAQLPPEAQQQALSKMTPQQQQLMQKALAATNANQTSTQGVQSATSGQSFPGGANPGIPQGAPAPTGMASPPPAP